MRMKDLVLLGQILRWCPKSGGENVFLETVLRSVNLSWWSSGGKREGKWQLFVKHWGERLLDILRSNFGTRDRFSPRNWEVIILLLLSSLWHFSSFLVRKESPFSPANVSIVCMTIAILIFVFCCKLSLNNLEENKDWRECVKMQTYKPVRGYPESLLS